MIACICCGVGELAVIGAIAAGGGAWFWDKQSRKKRKKMKQNDPQFRRIHGPYAESGGCIGPHTPSDPPESPQNDVESDLDPERDA